MGQRAGYSRALATHRFGSKAGLFAHVLQSALADWQMRLHQAAGALVGLDALCAATDAVQQYIRERPYEVRAMYMLWFLSIDSAADRSNIANVHRAQRGDVERWVRAGQERGEVDPAVNPARVAEQYAASMAGIAYPWLVNAEMPLEAMYRQLKADLNLRLQRSARTSVRKPVRTNQPPSRGRSRASVS